MHNASSTSLIRNFLLAAIALAASAATAEARGLVVATSEGPVRGISSGGVDRFLGIPYAAPPVGNLRWRPTQPHERWHGVRDATAFANHCPQVPSPYGQFSITEDCLYLNVFRPDHDEGEDENDQGDDEGHDGRLPVMVWIHGGALLVGESDDYDPVRLVRHGVVLVSINYRLGVLGFLAHPALTAESPDHASGDYGIMDQQAALRWVSRNIRSFGGDPSRVTIFGESAGGLSVHTHLASPLSAGLFHHAIVESGAYSLTQPSLSDAETQGRALAERVGCGNQTAECLRAVPVETLIVSLLTRSVVPNLEGHVLTQSIGAAIASGQFNRVPVIEGSNHDEWRLFVASDFDLAGGPLTPEQYVPAIAATLGVPLPVAEIIAMSYPLANYPSPDLALAAVGTDAVFACNSRKVAGLLSQYVSTFAYEFNDEEAPQLFLPPVSFPYGSAHASEIQYLFNLRHTVPAPDLTHDQRRLSRAMTTYWTNFARTGSPNWFGQPVWPAYDTARDEMQSLVPPVPEVESGFGLDHKCYIWTP
jgi:para-nitrobenzyl esterase